MASDIRIFFNQKHFENFTGEQIADFFVGILLKDAAKRLTEDNYDPIVGYNISELNTNDWFFSLN